MQTVSLHDVTSAIVLLEISCEADVKVRRAAGVVMVVHEGRITMGRATVACTRLELMLAPISCE